MTNGAGGGCGGLLDYWCDEGTKSLFTAISQMFSGDVWNI